MNPIAIVRAMRPHQWVKNVFVLMPVPFAVAGFVQLARTPATRATRWPLAALVLHVSIVAMLVYGIPRFRVPAEVTLVVCAAVAIVGLTRTDTSERV